VSINKHRVRALPIVWPHSRLIAVFVNGLSITPATDEIRITLGSLRGIFFERLPADRTDLLFFTVGELNVNHICSTRLKLLHK
jgi:hypothetical protein